MTKKILIIMMLTFNINSCLGMEYIKECTKELKTNAQEFWDKANFLTKVAVTLSLSGATSYILLNEWRHALKNRHIRTLKAQILSVKETSEQTKTVVDITTQHLYKTPYGKFIELIQPNNFNQKTNIKEIWLSHIFQTLEEKFNKKHFKKNFALRGMINTTIERECELLTIGLDNAATMLLGKNREYILYTKTENQTKENKEEMQQLSNETLRKKIVHLENNISSTTINNNAYIANIAVHTYNYLEQQKSLRKQGHHLLV